MIELVRYDLSEFSTRADLQASCGQLREIISALPSASIDKGPWVAGGAVRRAVLGDLPKASDIDVFFSSEGQKEEFVKALTESGKAKETRRTEHLVEYEYTVDTPESVDSPPQQYSVKLQLIFLAYYTDAEQVLDSFDFTICQFVADPYSLAAYKYALYDALRKRLVIHKLTYAVASLRRILKYKDQGFTACNGMFSEFLQQCVASPTVINADMQYID